MSVVAQPASSPRRRAPARARVSGVIDGYFPVSGTAILAAVAPVRVVAFRLGDLAGALAFRQVLLELADPRVEAFALHGVDAGHGLREPQLVDREREVPAD